MFAGAEAGADIVDGSIDSMSGLSSQPCLGALVAALGDKNNVDLDALSVLNEYWESVRHQYNPFEVQALNAAIGSSVYKRECSLQFEISFVSNHTNLSLYILSLITRRNPWRPVHKSPVPKQTTWFVRQIC